MVFNEKCRKLRQVKNCGECCRFVNCRDHIPYIPNNYDGCLRLGFAIIGGAVEEYDKAYKCGKKSKCNALKKWFMTERTFLLSDEKYDGRAIIDALELKCFQKYGALDDIWKKKEAQAQIKIALIKKQIKETADPKEKHKLMVKINKIRGELNE